MRNVTGSFAIELLMTFFRYRANLNPAWRLFLVTGVPGGYTTFFWIGAALLTSVRESK